MTLSFEEARACVLREVRAGRGSLATEQVPSLEAAGRVLAEEITADRDYPPFARSARDGFAVRAADVPGELTVIGVDKDIILQKFLTQMPVRMEAARHGGELHGVIVEVDELSGHASSIRRIAVS